MKKTIFIVVLTCIVMGAAVAQQQPATPAPATPVEVTPVEVTPVVSVPAITEKKNAAGLDLFQLFNGFITTDNDFSVFAVSASYERLIAPHFSIGADLDLYFLKIYTIDGIYLSLAAEGRYYPFSENFEKFFLGTTLGYNSLSVDGSSKPEDGGFSGLTVSLKAGYKLITAKIIYLEPSLSCVLSKAPVDSLLMLGSSITTPLSWQGGLRFGILF